ncbi:MmcQ/YjbR family DNA-binding protein [Gordonia crocea]|uniref:Phosphoribosylglycinamide formyltransferase n=1 Tax=Gordonia crocea TaxID=589162 RepID=A0A7I9UZ38_9ACTN|nr:MmcQ/YjbR family DNA-binding protein [Gordonia crocea]GED98375.1 phosphoribosylglycinamide formyltransferase [Gordonia crocea]
MPHPIMFSDDDPFLARIREMALAFPTATEQVAHGRPTFRCPKMFGMYGGGEKNIEKGVPGRRFDQSILFVADPAEREALLADERFFLPAYVGAFGWVGLILDDDTDWTEVGELLDASFREVAPKRTIAELDAHNRHDP